VTRLGLGTAALGGWPEAVSAEQGRATVRAAWDAGLRYFDTAPFYGYGKSEGFINDGLSAEDPGSFTLSTKVGRVLLPGREEQPLYADGLPFTPVFDFSAGGINRSLDASRQRLGRRRIDIAFIHDPDDHIEQAIEHAQPALVDLRDAGEIGAVGVGINFTAPLLRILEKVELDCALLAGRYTLLEQDPLDELFDVVAERGMSIVAGAVYNSGLLVDPGPASTYNYAPAPEHLLAKAERLAEVCAGHGVPLRAAALQFAAAHPVVATVVIGARTASEVADNVAMASVPIPDELWTALKERDLVHPDAPTPP
jgi:D-threo-aldose 1-dehydrogenase